MEMDREFHGLDWFAGENFGNIDCIVHVERIERIKSVFPAPGSKTDTFTCAIAVSSHDRAHFGLIFGQGPTVFAQGFDQFLQIGGERILVND